MRVLEPIYPMRIAPKNGTLIKLFVWPSHPPVVVRWQPFRHVSNGGYWTEIDGNSSFADSYGYVGWLPADNQVQERGNG